MFLSKYKNIEKNTPFDGKTIKSSDTVELLGITLDKNINFKRRIENICHYRRLRAIYELLHLSGKKKIQAYNLQILIVEVYKCLNNIGPPFTWDYFK